jgi:hypothetical protein
MRYLEDSEEVKKRMLSTPPEHSIPDPIPKAV